MVIKCPEEKNTKIFFGFSELEMLEGKKKIVVGIYMTIVGRRQIGF